MHYTKQNAKEPNKFCQGAKFGSGATEVDNPDIQDLNLNYLI